MQPSNPYAELSDAHERVKDEIEQQKLDEQARKFEANVKEQLADWQQQQQLEPSRPETEQERLPPRQNEYYNTLDRKEDRIVAIYEANLAGDQQKLDEVRQDMFGRGLTAAEVRSEFDAAENYGRAQEIKASQEVKEADASTVENEKDDRAARLEEFLARREAEQALEQEHDLDID
jgi:hypothetical protein